MSSGLAALGDNEIGTVVGGSMCFVTGAELSSARGSRDAAPDIDEALKRQNHPDTPDTAVQQRSDSGGAG